MTFDSLLEVLTREPAEAARERAETAFDRVAAPFQDRIVVMGAGALGNMVHRGLVAAGVTPVAFCDNNAKLWGSQKDGVIVLSPAEAVARYNDSTVFVVAVYNTSGPVRQLETLGCKRVVSHTMLFWKFWRSMPHEYGLELPDRILAAAEDIAAGYELLADNKSRREFCAQIRWRCLLEEGVLPQPDDPRELYFPRDLFALLPDEVFVDCGAFDGDSVRLFLGASHGEFGKIYAWEADSGNVGKLREYRDRLPQEQGGRIEVVPYAVGARNETIRFTAEGWMGSRAAGAGGNVEMECRTLDSVLADVEPTLIKMDIEGAEPDALRGAVRTMAKRPVMAVCTYHHCDHLWKIPQLLRAGNPDYQIFLRRYAEDCWEMVYYAVPPERLQGSFLPALSGIVLSPESTA